MNRTIVKFIDLSSLGRQAQPVAFPDLPNHLLLAHVRAWGYTPSRVLTNLPFSGAQLQHSLAELESMQSHFEGLYRDVRLDRFRFPLDE